MPIKQVVCSICKETVNKAVTYHVGGENRACKKHEGVSEKKGQLQVEQAKKSEMQIQKLEHQNRPWRESSFEAPSLEPKCWVCMNTGLRSQEFFLRYLVEVEKESKVTGKTSIPLFDTKVKMKERCIFVLTKEAGSVALKYVREDFKNLVEMSGVIAICGGCCHVSNINPMPKVEWEQLTAFMPMSELVIRPAIEAQAAKELARDN